MIKWATILLASAGLAIGIYTAATATLQAPNVPLVGDPSVNPFPQGFAATGIVEAASRNIQLAAPEGAIVTQIYVQVGQRVAANDPLFELDARPLQADLLRARAARDSARASLARTQAQPRPESIPPLEAAVASAQAEVHNLESQVALWESVSDPRAVSQDDLSQRRFALLAARGQLAQAQANLTLTRAGAWGPDLDIARAQLAQAEADVQSTQILIDRRTVRAPIDGTILKRNIEPGQFAPAAAGSSAITLGDLSKLHIRAQVDEEDLPLLHPGARATARIRGQKNITTPLTMVRIEPLAQPKGQLSGATTERVDTRVLEVVFEVQNATGLPLYPGQLVDVFIDGAPQ